MTRENNHKQKILTVWQHRFVAKLINLHKIGKKKLSVSDPFFLKKNYKIYRLLFALLLLWLIL